MRKWEGKHGGDGVHPALQAVGVTLGRPTADLNKALRE